jgi:hypothetical protein
MAQTFSAVLLLKRKEWLDPGELITDLRLLVEQTGADVRLDPRTIHNSEKPRGFLSLFSPQTPRTIFFELDGVRLRITQHAEPAADERAIHKYINPALWPTGLGEVTAHRAFIRIDESGIEGEEGPDAIFDRAAAVTATASVVARLTEPVGVIWLPACNTVPVPAFREAVTGLLDGVAPLELWVRWFAVPPGEKEDLSPGVVTSGFAAFSGRELRMGPSRFQTSELLENVFELARRLIDEKLALGNEQRVQLADGTVLHVGMRASPGRGEPPILELTREPALRGGEAEGEGEERVLREAVSRRGGPGPAAPAGKAAPPAGSAGGTGRPGAGPIRVIPGGKRDG